MSREDARKLRAETRIVVEGYDDGSHTYSFRKPRTGTVVNVDNNGINAIIETASWTTLHVPFQLAHLPASPTEQVTPP